MQHRTLGKTGLKVSAIGFGGIPILRIPVEDAVRVLHHALDRGITFIDTHRTYGDSEEKIGRVLEERRSECLIATKVARHAYEEAEEDLEASLKALRTDYIDLYQIKSLDNEERLDQAMTGSLELARKAQRDGVIGHIGFTSHSEEISLKALRTGAFETMMYPYNVVRREAEGEIFKLVEEMNIGFICMKPVAGGALTVPSEVARFVADGNGQGSTALGAMKYVLASDRVSVAIPGLKSIEEVDEAVRAGEMIDRITEEDKEHLYELAEELGANFCRNCGYCLPCSQEIKINDVFRFMGYYQRYGLKEWATSQYEDLDVKADVCVECEECLARCPYDVKIPEKLQEAVALFA